jgi:imidazolonepropionase-like amidohydrolase
MSIFLFKNARVFDGTQEECRPGQQVLVEGGRIREVSDKPITSAGAEVIDVAGRTLMPGLIDAHMHAYASDVSVQKVDLAGTPYRTAHAARMLGHLLDSGFTTVRDVGGGDYSLSRAIADGLIRAPRYLYSGKILSMTGGHGDFRTLEEIHHDHELGGCVPMNSFCVIADGVDECVKAAREQLRRGAHCIKIMGSGGVLSPTDPIWMNQYREDEIRAIVNETRERRTYTAAHCHGAEAIRRCVEYGVRSIEHGTLIDDATAQFVAERGAFIVPTMAIIYALVKTGRAAHLSAEIRAKADVAYQQALTGMSSMRKAGVKIGFGTDLLGITHTERAPEFIVRREVFSSIEILRQATSINAELVQQAGTLGCIRPEAQADLLVVDGNPDADISLLAAGGEKLSLIMRGGEIVKNRLG